MFFQENRFCPPPCSEIRRPIGRAAEWRRSPVPLVGDQDQVLDAAKLDGLRFAACSAHGRPLGWPRALTLPSGQFAPIFDPAGARHP